MTWSITYYNERVRKAVMAMLSGIVADYVRLTDAMALDGCFIARKWVTPLWCCIRSSRRPKKPPMQNCIWPVND